MPALTATCSCSWNASGAAGNSDALCLVPNTGSSIGGPRLFSVQLDGSGVATFTWAASAVAVEDGYRLMPLGGNPVDLPSSTNRATQAMAGPTCYSLLATLRGAPLGNTDVLCGFPGLARFPAPVTSATPTPTARATQTTTSASTLTPTRTPTATGAVTASPTHTPFATGATYVFGNEVSASDRNLITNLVEMTQRYWGAAAVPMRVYAFASVDELIGAYLRDCACQEPGNLRGELQAPGHWATTAPGALLIQASPTGAWGQTSARVTEQVASLTPSFMPCIVTWRWGE